MTTIQAVPGARPGPLAGRRMAPKSIVALALLLGILATQAGCAASQAQTDVRMSMNSPGHSVGISYFYESLSPSGDWVEDSRYGWCWTPYDMAPGWRPYRDGHWEYTDYGWSWASDESWGWATYHYGRWFFDDDYGWLWVPGNEWAPAWVAWRYGDDCVGWAPLPPGAMWDHSTGLEFGDADRIPAHEWCFVPRPHMLDANVRLQVIVVARNFTMISRSRDATRFEVRNGRPANVGIDVEAAGRFVGRPVRQMKIVDAGTPGGGAGRAVGGGVSYFRPAVRPAPASEVPAPAPRRSVASDQVVRRQQETQQRNLENDLVTEHRRLQRDQQDELRARPPSPAVDAIRNQHAEEERSFQANAVQQRQVLAQRMQKKLVKPEKPRGGRQGQSKDGAEPAKPDTDKNRGKAGR